MATSIVVPPALYFSTATSAAAKWQQQHSAHRSLLLHALENQEIANSIFSVAGSAQEPFARSSGYRARPPRSLDALGLLLVDDLTSSEEQRLVSQGASILPNTEVHGVQPTGRSPSVIPAVTQLWHLQKVGVTSWHGRGITGKGALIGILDTGIDASHQAFAGKQVSFQEFDSSGFPVGSAPKDYGEHGTHVCGTIAGNGCGMAPGAGLAVAAVLTSKQVNGSYSGKIAQLLSGLNWLLQTQFSDGPVAVINASLTSQGYDNFCYQILEQARRVLGVLSIAAIGNGGPPRDRHGSPGNYDCVIGVGATDQADVVARFSDYGAVAVHQGLLKPDLCAPGIEILSAVPGGGYVALDGTSMASAIVAGACALLIEANPGLAGQPDVLQGELLKNAVALQDTMRSGSGRLELQGLGP